MSNLTQAILRRQLAKTEGKQDYGEYLRNLPVWKNAKQFLSELRKKQPEREFKQEQPKTKLMEQPNPRDPNYAEQVKKYGAEFRKKMEDFKKPERGKTITGLQGDRVTLRS